MSLSHFLDEARNIQAGLRKKVKIVPLKKRPAFIAGVDAAFAGKTVIAAACLFRYPELIPLEDSFATGDVTIPYIPGFLSFREGPAIGDAVRKLSRKPDIILCDGQGIAHPAGMGIAAHMGVLLNMPSIGCAKSRLVGTYDEPGKRKGQQSALKYNNKTVGTVLRSRDNVKPLFISPGHLIDLKDSVEIVMQSLGKYRIPEPLRRADFLSKALTKRYSGKVLPVISRSP